jgi:hypothetical protein
MPSKTWAVGSDGLSDRQHRSTRATLKPSTHERGRSVLFSSSETQFWV